jgi:uncharacterized protein (DUF2236 family)
VRRVHEHITGTDTITGHRYAASDPALLLWVHATLVESSLVAARAFGTPLAPEDSDAYVAEMTAAAELVGIPAGLTPASLAGLESYLAATRPELRCTPAAAESMAYLLDPPGLDEDVAEIWADVKDGVLAVLPAWAREMYRYTSPPLTEARQTEIRQALGVLDAVFLGEPGVLEARQLITLRMRAARQA